MQQETVESSQVTVVAPKRSVHAGIAMIRHLSGCMSDCGKPAAVQDGRRARAEGAGVGPSVSPGRGTA
jgi:hypothetical protein